MRALSGCLCHYRPGETIGEPGYQWIASEAAAIDAADEFRDSIADHRPVSHSFGRSKTGSTWIVRFSEAGNSGPTFGHLAHGF
jgi:hypothetical protein